MSFAERSDYDLLDTLLDLNTSIFREHKYPQGTTTIATTPFEVYSLRRGVCQDFTNLFICLARLLGVPARYVCGYLLVGGGSENRAQCQASHAWAQVYLPEVGWKRFDTNGVLTQTDHRSRWDGATWTRRRPQAPSTWAAAPRRWKWTFELSWPKKPSPPERSDALHAHLHRHLLLACPLVDAARGRDIRVIAAGGEADVVIGLRGAVGGIERQPPVTLHEHVHPRVRAGPRASSRRDHVAAHVARGQTEDAAGRDHEVGEVLAHSPPRVERLIRCRLHRRGPRGVGAALAPC